MAAIFRIINRCGLTEPDGRPLHAYDFSPEDFADMAGSLRSCDASGRVSGLVAARFVFWAAEHIRANFSGGSLTWDFIFGAINWPEDQGFGRKLTARGLEWWGREIRVSDAGTRMFLYSLMAEGGIPEALLSNPGLYRDVVLGLLKEIETEGGMAAKSWSERIAARWIVRLPQTFQSPDIARLLGGLALSLAELRSDLPADLPEAAAERWLNEHRPGWISRLPLRMTPEIAETLIHPALRADREPSSVLPGLFCKRELRRDETGTWHGYLSLSDDGWLPAALFQGAEELRLRLLPAGTKTIDGLTYSAAPEGKGWRLRRFGGAGGVRFPFHPQEPFALAAFADGRMKGEAVIDPGFSAPDETPSFWGSADRTEGAAAQRLTPLSNGGKTRAPCIWILTSQDVEPEAADAGLILEQPETAPDGSLWRISGNGSLRIGERRYRIETGSEGEAPEARFTPSGKILRGWRLKRNAPVYRGEVVFFGQIGASDIHRIPEHELRRTRGRLLFSELVEWVRKDDILASIQLVRIPEATRFKLREEAPGQVAFEAEGLENEWRITMRAGGVEARSDVINGTVKLTLETPGMATGLIDLRLSEPAAGAALDLQTHWPARRGMILGPEGERLTEHRPISAEALNGWRAIVPEGSVGDLQLCLTGQRAISLPIAREGSLTAHRPLIEAMLAQGGPDAQVNLSLVVGGDESKRLEIRRYHEKTIIDDGILRIGLDRDAPITPETALASQLSKIRSWTFHAVDMVRPECHVTIPDPASTALRSLLGDTVGPWLIQPRLEGRIQRAVVWNPHPTPQTSRDERIETYAEEWRRLVSTPEDPEWERLWRLITAAGQGGDAGMLDEVQALAQMPAAAICLALRIHPHTSIWEVQALDAVASIFWPTVLVADFTEAVQADRKRRLAKLSPFFDAQEAEDEADRSLVKRINQISTIMPGLAGHFGQALVRADLLERIVRSPDLPGMLKPLSLSNPGDHLTESAQAAARRFDRLPAGVQGLEPLHRSGRLRFNRYAQSVIDAPLVAAEMAAGRRAEPSIEEKLILINLRLVDPIYFDAALPAALHLLFAPESRT